MPKDGAINSWTCKLVSELVVTANESPLDSPNLSQQVVVSLVRCLLLFLHFLHRESQACYCALGCLLEVLEIDELLLKAVQKALGRSLVVFLAETVIALQLIKLFTDGLDFGCESRQTQLVINSFLACILKLLQEMGVVGLAGIRSRLLERAVSTYC